MTKLCSCSLLYISDGNKILHLRSFLFQIFLLAFRLPVLLVEGLAVAWSFLLSFLLLFLLPLSSSFVCACVHVCRPVCRKREVNLMHHSSSMSALCFWDGVSHMTGRSPRRLGWLASEAQGPNCPFLHPQHWHHKPMPPCQPFCFGSSDQIIAQQTLGLSYLPSLHSRFFLCNFFTFLQNYRISSYVPCPEIQ